MDHSIAHALRGYYCEITRDGTHHEQENQPQVGSLAGHLSGTPIVRQFGLWVEWIRLQ
jgi:hypothetical protein